MKPGLVLSGVIICAVLALNAETAEKRKSNPGSQKSQGVPPHSAPCASYTQDIPLGKKLASASLWDTLSNSERSIQSSVAKALALADQGLARATGPTNLCPASCQLPPRPEIVFSAIPHQYLSRYAEQTKCEAYYQKTRKEPLRYHNKLLRSTDDINHWFSAFSQGSGPDGADLYRRCDGLCSPAYTTFISKEGAQFRLNVEVVCGHARDKQDSQYELTFKYRWVCQEKPG